MFRFGALSFCVGIIGTIFDYLQKWLLSDLENKIKKIDNYIIITRCNIHRFIDSIWIIFMVSTHCYCSYSIYNELQLAPLDDFCGTGILLLLDILYILTHFSVLDKMERIDCNFNSIYNSNYNSSYESCSICLEEYNGGDAIVRLKCNHMYHEMCLNRWKNGCAICRIDNNV